MNHSEATRNVHPPLQRSTSLWSRICAWLTTDTLWQPFYRDLSLLFWCFCGPVFLAVGLVLVFGGEG
jgi:hypothetical protein